MRQPVMLRKTRQQARIHRHHRFNHRRLGADAGARTQHQNRLSAGLRDAIGGCALPDQRAHGHLGSPRFGTQRRGQRLFGPAGIARGDARRRPVLPRQSGKQPRLLLQFGLPALFHSGLDIGVGALRDLAHQIIAGNPQHQQRAQNQQDKGPVEPVARGIVGRLCGVAGMVGILRGGRVHPTFLPAVNAHRPAMPREGQGYWP